MADFDNRNYKFEPIKKNRGPAWIITFADLMSILMAFFILLLSTSTVEHAKFNKVGDSMRKALSSKIIDNIMMMEPEIDSNEQSTLEVIQDYKKISDILKNEIKGNTIEIELHGRVITIRMHDPAMFDTGEARLSASFLIVLYKLKDTLKDIHGQFIVSGHTDDTPIKNNKYRSNWELSASRAYSVIAQLIDELKLPPERFILRAFGETKPLVSNENEVNRARNRRVELMIDQRGVADIATRG